MKRLLATILTIIMALSIMSNNVFAVVESIDSTELTKNSSNRENVVVIVLGDGENEHEVCIGCEPVSMNGLCVPLKSLATFIDYKYDQKLNDIEINMTNGNRDITLNCFSKKAIVDGKEIELKWTIEAPANAESPYINADDIEAVFSYDVACDFNKNVVVMTVTDNTPKAIIEVEPPTEEIEPFTDIKGHWAEQRIIRIANKGIISGYPDGTFKPDAPITRAEFAKIASVAFDLQVKSALNYDDVKPDDWYYSYLENSDMYIPIYALPTSYETNIPYQTISQQGLNNFLPNTPAMRMHIAEALVKIKIEQENIDIAIPDISIIKSEIESKFTDDDYENLYAMHGKISENVQRMFEYTWLANELRIMQGDDNGKFNPYGNVTRAELVTMIDRMLVKVSGTPLFYDYSDLFDMELNDIKTMEIQSGTTGEIITINSSETIEKVFSLLSTSQYKTDVRSGNYDGWSYAVTMLSNDGEQLFRYVINTGIKIGDKNYLIEDDTYKLKNLINEIYTNTDF